MLIKYRTPRRASCPPQQRSKTPQPRRKRIPSPVPRSRTPNPTRRATSYGDLDTDKHARRSSLERIHLQVKNCLSNNSKDSKTVSETVRSEPPRAFEMSQTPHLSEAQVTEFKEAFAMFDKNGDGSISRSELGTVMKNLGQNPTDNELSDMIKEADDNENGCVDFSEFLILMSKKMSMLDIDQELLEAFSVFDKDGNGYIDKDELTNVLSSLDEDLDEEQVKAMMKQADKNGDGLVSFDEFKEVMCSKG